MLASLVAAALATWPAAESASWVAQLRARLTGVTSVAANYSRTVTGPNGRHHHEHELRLARWPNGGEWVGDLIVRQSDRPAGPVRYTLWRGKVYEAVPDARKLTEYTPHDGDPLRMAAEYYVPLLHLLTDGPGRPTLYARLIRRDGHYRYHTLRVPDPLLTPLSARWEQPEADRWGFPAARLTVAAVALDGFDIPRHLPRQVHLHGSDGRETQQFDVTAVRLDAADGPTPADIADPTVRPAGWHFVSMAEVWAEVGRRSAEERAKRTPRSPG